VSQAFDSAVDNPCGFLYNRASFTPVLQIAF
jgi:hypothetical protein